MLSTLTQEEHEDIVLQWRVVVEDLVRQFGYYGPKKGRLHVGSGGLSALEDAFDILGWSDPHPTPEAECQHRGCHEEATCGTPTKNGYKRLCDKHSSEYTKENGK